MQTGEKVSGIHVTGEREVTIYRKSERETEQTKKRQGTKCTWNALLFRN